jgi:hypothetical protein
VSSHKAYSYFKSGEAKVARRGSNKAENFIFELRFISLLVSFLPSLSFIPACLRCRPSSLRGLRRGKFRQNCLYGLGRVQARFLLGLRCVIYISNRGLVVRELTRYRIRNGPPVAQSSRHIYPIVRVYLYGPLRGNTILPTITSHNSRIQGRSIGEENRRSPSRNPVVVMRCLESMQRLFDLVYTRLGIHLLLHHRHHSNLYMKRHCKRVEYLTSASDPDIQHSFQPDRQPTLR